MVKYLNEKHNLRYLLENIGYSQAYYINQYLKSGDESLLKSLYTNTTVYGYRINENDFDYKESYDFWTELRKYNLTLPENRRLIAIGIGSESQEWTVLKYINSLLSQSEPPAEIKPYIKAFKDKYQEKSELDEKFDKMDKSSEKETGKALQDLEDKDRQIGKSIQNLQKTRATYSDIYEKYLGSSYFDFNLILDNINIDNIGGITPIESNANIYSNFKKIYSNLPMGKYFGEFVMEQVYQNNSHDKDNGTGFAMYLNCSDSPVKGRVLSIAYAYEKSKALLYQKVVDVETCGPFKIDIFKNIGKSDILLFKLNGENSPFTAKCYFLTSKDDIHTTDYFKYIMIIKNSKASEYAWKILIE